PRALLSFPTRRSSDLGRSVAAAQAQLLRAGRPRLPALGLQDALGDPDLLGLAGLVGHALATVGAPSPVAELQPTVVAVTRIDLPVATALALGELVPGRHRGRVRGTGDGKGSADRNSPDNSQSCQLSAQARIRS